MFFRKKSILLKSILFLIYFLLITNTGLCENNILNEIANFNGFSGICIKDLESQDLLFSYNQDNLFTPASLVKIFTLLGALEKMGPDYLYKTIIYFSSTIPGEVDGDLYIKGFGDPTQDPEIIRQIVLNLIYKYKLTGISGDIVLDDSSFFKEDYLGKGWMWDDQNPIIGAFTIKGYHSREKHVSYYQEMTREWGQLFSIELIKQKIDFNGSIRLGEIPPDLTVKDIYYSDELTEILSHMMKMSDNQSAEIIFRTLPFISDLKEVSTIDFSIIALSDILEKKLSLTWGEDYILMDGCGLSEYNLLTPEQVVMAIDYLYRQYGSEMLKYFANTEERGTLKERFSFPLWGKTGSLPSASGLAGILNTKNNRCIAFCILTNSFLGEQNNPKKFEDMMVNYIYENY